MKKISKFLLVITLIMGLSLTAGCNKEQKEEQEPKTVASTLAEQFNTEIKDSKNIEEVAKKISQNEIIKPVVEATKVEEYMPGFTTEIKGYNEVYMVAPMIGTIPFVAYIFESDDAKELANTLKESADLRWNICTEADDMEISVVDNYVFFVMAPSSFE